MFSWQLNKIPERTSASGSPGGSVFSYIAEPAELRRRGEAVIEVIRAGWLRVDEGKAYPLDRGHRSTPRYRESQHARQVVPDRLADRTC